MRPAPGTGQAALEGRALHVSLKEPEAVLGHVCVLCKMFKVSKLLAPKIPLSPKAGSGTKPLSRSPTLPKERPAGPTTRGTKRWQGWGVSGQRYAEPHTV